MRNLWDDADKITALLKSNQATILMLDFDGTLVPIVKFYQHATLPSQTKELLQNLSQKKGLYLAIISGRELAVLKDKISLPNIIYGGLHGLAGEIYGKGVIFPVPKEQILALDEIRNKLKNLENEFSGIFIEDKKVTLAFHYRQAEKGHIRQLKLAFNKIVNPYRKTFLISVVKGKKVLDIRPAANWNKGDFAKMVVEKISKMTHFAPLVFYIGDDKTDEDAFKSLSDGITIRVGKHNRSKAKYYLKDTDDVLKFLNWMYN